MSKTPRELWTQDSEISVVNEGEAWQSYLMFIVKGPEYQSLKVIHLGSAKQEYFWCMVDETLQAPPSTSWQDCNRARIPLRPRHKRDVTIT